ncbi:MarR family transcriptional regulator [Methylovulum sp.]|uniref:MarR family winged helix-turn-helix transcriptional regulator n=2 Tax=Methylovulum sp. TaxID=1916980 RepID=UPI00260D397E|nr:MarR family transcriptional regulator [Methylovulum sp.]
MPVSPTFQLHELLFRLIFLIRGRMLDVVQEAEAKLSPMQILVLRILVEEGEMPQNLLVKKMARDKAQVTRLVNSLAEQGLLSKAQDMLDKRSFLLKPSAEVQQIVTRFMVKEQQLVAEMVNGIAAEDIEKLEALLKVMQDNLTQ